MTNSRIESVCVFGSAARSSVDQLSDRDVLIVSNDRYRRQHLVNYWKRAGWSVAIYSPGRILKMVQAGSLFIQHIKLEGILLQDHDGWLEHLLQSAKEKQSYETDAKASVSLALPIERFSADESIEQNLIVSDLAYVAVRNFGICYLANRGVMIFDYYRIADHLGKDFGLNTRELELLYSFRTGKATYRGMERWGQVPGTVKEVRSILSKFFSSRPLGEIETDTPIRDLGNGYTMLRDFEAAAVSRIGRYGTVNPSSLIGLSRVFKLIRDPRTYAWDVRNLALSDLEMGRFMLEPPDKVLPRPMNIFGSAHSPLIHPINKSFNERLDLPDNSFSHGATTLEFRGVVHDGDDVVP